MCTQFPRLKAGAKVLSPAFADSTIVRMRAQFPRLKAGAKVLSPAFAGSTIVRMHRSCPPEGGG